MIHPRDLEKVIKAKELIEKFLDAANLKDANFLNEAYSGGDHDSPERYAILYELPILNGFKRRDIGIDYFPYHHEEGIYGTVLYRNKINSDKENIYDFLASSDFIKKITPFISSELRKIGGFNIPEEVWDICPMNGIKEFKLFDQKFHTEKGSKDYQYLMGIKFLITPKIWEKQAKTIGNIESAIKSYAQGKFEELKDKPDIVSITIN